MAPKSKTLVPSDASTVSVCFYEGETLRASALIDGNEAATLSDELNDAKVGRNPDVPEDKCLRDGEVPPPDPVIVVHGGDDSARVELTFSSCTHRGLSNGRDQAQLTQSLIQGIMNPVHTGYVFSPAGLP